MKRYAGARLLEGKVPNRRKPKGTTRRGTIHTTETPTARGFYDTERTKDYYTFQYLPLGWGGNGGFLQVLDPEQISHALRRDDGDPETNGEGIVNISLVMVGYARDIHKLADQDYLNLADFFIWAEAELGIPIEFPYDFRGGVCYGYGSPCRMTWLRWRTVQGWIGHQHVPGQTHWDPGVLQSGRILMAVDELKNPPTPGPDPEPEPRKRKNMFPLVDKEHFVATVTQAEINGYFDAGVILPDEPWAWEYWHKLVLERNPAKADWDELIKAITVRVMQRG